MVVCNTGHFGGSVAVAPYYKPKIRTIYRHEGKDLFTFQTVQLPIEGLNQAKRSIDPERMFKSLPPGVPHR